MYSGNAVVVNLAMRFPWLVPVAAAVGLAVIVPKEVPPLPPLPVVAKVPPAPAAPTVLKPVEALCPPAEKLTKAEVNKLSPKERGLLTVKGCIKG